jgi:hypothetical protein
MFAPSRDQVRSFLFDTWRKYLDGQPLVGLEQIALPVILMHPEYYELLAQPEQHRDLEYGPESGALNPFLHLSLHLAIAEQLSIDQPPGIRAEYERLAAKADEHDALHAVLECLGETLWEAQRLGTGPDEHAYLACLRRR